MRLDNIGDVVISGPALRAIKKELPHVRLTFMASPTGSQAAPLLPWVDEVLTARVLWQDLGGMPFDPDREWFLVKELRNRRFDGAIALTSFSQSPFPAGLVCLLAGIPQRAGFSKEDDPGIFTAFFEPPPDSTHQVDRNLYLLKALGFTGGDDALQIKIREEDEKSIRKLLSSHGVEHGGPYLLVNPWASARARTYPEDRFAKAALALAERSSMPVVITGSARDRERSIEMASLIGASAVNVVGQTSVCELAALVKNAALAITNDTSVMHLADALNTPEVVLYSGTELESQWRPRRTKHILIRRPTPCSPCYAFSCPRNLECLDIPPEEVAQAGIQLLTSLQLMPHRLRASTSLPTER